MCTVSRVGPAFSPHVCGELAPGPHLAYMYAVSGVALGSLILSFSRGLFLLRHLYLPRHLSYSAHLSSLPQAGQGLPAEEDSSVHWALSRTLRMIAELRAASHCPFPPPEQLGMATITSHVKPTGNGTCNVTLTCSVEEGENVTFSWTPLGLGPILHLSQGPGGWEGAITCTAQNPVSSSNASMDAKLLCTGGHRAPQLPAVSTDSPQFTVSIVAHIPHSLALSPVTARLVQAHLLSRGSPGHPKGYQARDCFSDPITAQCPAIPMGIECPRAALQPGLHSRCGMGVRAAPQADAECHAATHPTALGSGPAAAILQETATTSALR